MTKTQTMTSEGPAGFGANDQIDIEGSDDEQPTVVTFGDDGDDKDKITVVEETPGDKGGNPAEDETPGAEDRATLGSRAQKRIKTLTGRYHKQVEARKAAENEQAKALTELQRLQQENEALRTGMVQTNVSFASTMKERHEERMAGLKQKLSQAMMEGDTDAAADIQAAMAVAGGELANINQTQASLTAEQARRAAAAQQQQAQPQVPPQVPQQTQPAPQQGQQTVPLSPKLTSWLAGNSAWFNRPDETSAAKTRTAYAIHEDLLSEGYDGNDDDYYTELDARLTKSYPDHKPHVQGAGGDPDVGDLGSGEDDPAANQQTSALTPYSRQQSGSNTAGGGRRTVRLSPTEVAIAKRLGVTPEEYAASKLETN